MKDLVEHSATIAAIEKATEIGEIKGIRDWLESLRTYAKSSGASREKINRIAEPKVLAEWKGGLILRNVERGAAGRPLKNSANDEPNFTPYQAALSDAGLALATAKRWQVMSWVPDAALQEYFAATKETDKKIITSDDVFRLGKKFMPHDVIEPVPVDGKYAVLVIDPPWKMQKIERDVRPNQAGFDYPTMTEAELEKFGSTVRDMAADDCHAFIWTTQKHLPLALKLLDPWGLRYVLTMVWHKPGGFQPVGLPQFNCEFVIYARTGSPVFIDTKAFNCCFEAGRREHGRKPDEFYDVVRRVTAGPRIDVFSREKREGFEQYGNQPEFFSGAA